MNDKQDKDEKKPSPMDLKKSAPAPAPKAPPPTQEELNKALEELVVRAEAAGERDEPVIVNARALLDRKK